jgi:glycosyltransferase involved in cell wall biosynthesis
MRERRLRSMLGGAPPAPDRILYANLWFREANNQRYAELLPRLDRVDAYLLRCSGRRVVRGVQYRAWRSGATTLAQRLVAARAARRYRGLFCTEFRQIAAFPGPVVVDVDEPSFGPDDLALFTRPNVAAFVTTTDWAAARFRDLGVTAPTYVVPQGVTLRGFTPEAVRAEAAARGDGPVVAYTAAWLLAGSDPGAANGLYNVEGLLELWGEIHARLPEAQLWLVGGAGPEVERRTAGRPDVRLLGRVPRERVLPILANADLALYTRRERAGLAAMKISDYLAAGLPVVSYDEELVRAQLEPTGAAAIVSTGRELVDAVVRLAGDEAARAPLAAAAHAAGQGLDWDVLARRYEAEILDRHLPPRG